MKPFFGILYAAAILCGCGPSQHERDAAAYVAQFRTNSPAPSPPVVPPVKIAPLYQVKILDWEWSADNGVMIISFTISNGAPVDVKDITIRCVHSAPSGTEIDRNTRTVYEIVRAGEVKRFKSFNMGFVHSQATKSRASIVSVVPLE